MSWADLSPEDQKFIRERFTSGQDVCRHCGAIHLRACPRIRRIVFRKADEIAEIEFWPESMITWPEGIIWPEEVEPEEPVNGEAQAQNPDQDQQDGAG